MRWQNSDIVQLKYAASIFIFSDSCKMKKCSRSLNRTARCLGEGGSMDSDADACVCDLRIGLE